MGPDLLLLSEPTLEVGHNPPATEGPLGRHRGRNFLITDKTHSGAMGSVNTRKPRFIRRMEPHPLDTPVQLRFPVVPA